VDKFFFPNRSLPQSPLSHRGGEPSAGTGFSPAEDRGGKCTIVQGAQKVSLIDTAGV